MSLKTAKKPAARDKDALTRTLEMEIIFGRLFPNQRLIEDELMERFGQSRHRVRQSIDALVLGGLAVRETNKGAHVCSYSSTEIREMYELRSVLQTAALTRMALPLAADDIRNLRDLHARHVAASTDGDLTEVFHIDNAFHAAIFGATPNAVMAEAIAVQAKRTHPIRSLNFNSDQYLNEAQTEHAAMIDALESGDRETLIALHDQHIMRPMHAYLQQYGLDPKA
ncbi:GntR family transcriptional regulator [Sulfitobacter sp. S190]|uniref:GntR family transcriptional regulator n=1 Tax=Sulfitobacter sp. S190 TaxID=2867022 RepID=UPI0021A2689C|nr:GntR family transcriptional regulator [Sulfitobacter sp. S190]UWR21930.1 GntR family transcriptional regulator [Sulfitobacter sp. S190]